MTKERKRIAVVGGGLTGSLVSIYLAQRGYSVDVFDRRPDMRKKIIDGGRSINLALSTRGIRALEEVGVADAVAKASIPMNGRMMHDHAGNLTFLAYGKEGEYINSISRISLNSELVAAAEAAGVRFHFEQACVGVDTYAGVLSLKGATGAPSSEAFDFIIGADGAWSAVRQAMQRSDRYNYTQDFIDHGYKEFHIPAEHAGAFQIEKNALHIWPRASFMMIALPNPDGSFTGTLFYPFEGDASFKTLATDVQIKEFFTREFPDFTKITPDYLADFHHHKTSSLMTIKCYPWVQGKVLLVGDAAHAIVPFYGQGMNAGFEDCRILNQVLQKNNDDWDDTVWQFQKMRKTDTDAIARLALDNFIEMRDLVSDAKFLLRKKIEAKLHALYPTQWIPLYSMVTFHPEIRYSEALAAGLRQRKIMDVVMKIPNLESDWPNLDFGKIVAQLSEE